MILIITNILAAMEENSWIWIVQLLGRLHPSVVPFPIGLIIVATLLEVLTIKGKRKRLHQEIARMVYLGAIFLVITTCLGWFLDTFDNYNRNLGFLHQYFGIATAVLAAITAVMLFKFIEVMVKPEKGRTYRTIANRI